MLDRGTSAARCLKSVTENRDNRTNDFRADELAGAAGVTRRFRSQKQLFAEWLKGKARVRTLISVIFVHKRGRI
jgi:hypothetical protein